VRLAAVPDTPTSGARAVREITDLIAMRGRLTQNAFVESFNGRTRDEYLNETLLILLAYARESTAISAGNCNTRRTLLLGYATLGV
jgi:transposase InsO family protein